MRIKLPVAVIAALLVTAPALALAKPLTVCTEASPDGFDVVQFNSLVTTNASADVIFNSLVAYDEAAKKVVPALAQSWDVSADGLTYTFHLRPNVQFQTTDYFKPTHALNADDVVFTFSRMLDDSNPWHKVTGASGFPHAQSMGLPKLIKSVAKVDDNTVKFELNQPDATFVSILTMGFASIYSAEYADQLLKAGKQVDLNAKPIGTGPFVLKSYTKDAVIRYDVNPTYWGPKPKVDRLIYAITPDATVRAQKVKTGECQIALSPKPQDVADAKTDKSLAIVQTPAFMTAFVALNTDKKPLDNQKVRAALNMAFDRTTYLKTVFDNTASAGCESVSAEHLELQQVSQGVAVRPGEGEEPARRGRLSERFLDHHLGAADGQRAQSESEGRRRTAAGRLREDRREGGGKGDRVGRADQGSQAGPARHAVHGLGRRQRRPGQLPVAAV